jgi:nickel superoxide dismutase
MKNFALATVCLAVSLAGVLNGNEPAINNSAPAVEPVSTAPVPHCEVPCGIYADQMRFQQMLEDTATIAKAITSVSEFAGSLGDDPPTAKGINQANRWVTTKENHATNTQHIVSQYFLTQRIKQDHKDYTGQLATAHRVLVAAMKCKQDCDPATAGALKKAIYDLYRAYEGKEPAFEQEK